MVQSSLFDPTAEPNLSQGIGWVEQVTFGPLATTLCVIAVALFGFRLLTGHFYIGNGLRTIIGVFVILGAPALVASLMLATERKPISSIPLAQAEADPARDLAPVESDPYAGASLRRD